MWTSTSNGNSFLLSGSGNTMMAGRVVYGEGKPVLEDFWARHLSPVAPGAVT